MDNQTSDDEEWIDLLLALAESKKGEEKSQDKLRPGWNKLEAAFLHGNGEAVFLGRRILLLMELRK